MSIFGRTRYMLTSGRPYKIKVQRAVASAISFRPLLLTLTPTCEFYSLRMLLKCDGRNITTVVATTLSAITSLFTLVRRAL